MRWLLTSVEDDLSQSLAQGPFTSESRVKLRILCEIEAEKLQVIYTSSLEILEIYWYIVQARTYKILAYDTRIRRLFAGAFKPCCTSIEVGSFADDRPILELFSTFLNGYDPVIECTSNGTHGALKLRQFNIVFAFYADAANGGDDHGSAHSERLKKTAVG